MGKGTALRTGITEANGHILVIQDADLEYHSQEYPKIIQPIIENIADVIYGFRFKKNNFKQSIFSLH